MDASQLTEISQHVVSVKKHVSTEDFSTKEVSSFTTRPCNLFSITGVESFYGRTNFLTMVLLSFALVS